MRPADGARLRILRDWLRKADADMALAEHLLSDAAQFTNAIAFHCQQAAEKYLKAFLTWHTTEFPKTHDLDQLLDLVRSVDASLAEGLRGAIVLTPYGVELRYPGDRPDVTPDEARQAVSLARQVRDVVLGRLPRDACRGSGSA